ncbi:hypothetical protein [Treponema denticola]|nr:hypothetical protein [Treponema denticola]
MKKIVNYKKNNRVQSINYEKLFKITLRNGYALKAVFDTKEEQS